MAKKKRKPKKAKATSKPKRPGTALARDAGGRFAKGHSGGPGRPPAEREAFYLRVFRETVTSDRLAAMIEEAFGIAMDTKTKAGDRLKAMEFLSRYLLPEPRQRLAIEQAFSDPAEVHEFRIAGATASEIDDRVKLRLSKLIFEQKQYDAQLADPAARAVPAIPQQPQEPS